MKVSTFNKISDVVQVLATIVGCGGIIVVIIILGIQVISTRLYQDEVINKMTKEVITTVHEVKVNDCDILKDYKRIAEDSRYDWITLGYYKDGWEFIQGFMQNEYHFKTDQELTEFLKTYKVKTYKEYVDSTNR
jgi:hypothetical protein